MKMPDLLSVITMKMPDAIFVGRGHVPRRKTFPFGEGGKNRLFATDF